MSRFEASTLDTEVEYYWGIFSWLHKYVKLRDTDFYGVDKKTLAAKDTYEQWQLLLNEVTVFKLCKF